MQPRGLIPILPNDKKEARIIVRHTFDDPNVSAYAINEAARPQTGMPTAAWLAEMTRFYTDTHPILLKSAEPDLVLPTTQMMAQLEAQGIDVLRMMLRKIPSGSYLAALTSAARDTNVHLVFSFAKAATGHYGGHRKIAEEGITTFELRNEVLQPLHLIALATAIRETVETHSPSEAKQPTFILAERDTTIDYEEIRSALHPEWHSILRIPYATRERPTELRDHVYSEAERHFGKGLK